MHSRNYKERCLRAILYSYRWQLLPFIPFCHCSISLLMAMSIKWARGATHERIESLLDTSQMRPRSPPQNIPRHPPVPKRPLRHEPYGRPSRPMRSYNEDRYGPPPSERLYNTSGYGAPAMYKGPKHHDNRPSRDQHSPPALARSGDDKSVHHVEEGEWIDGMHSPKSMKASWTYLVSFIQSHMASKEQNNLYWIHLSVKKTVLCGTKLLL